ncbi:MAG: segregation and condensation protein A [Thiothrix sp.]|nr:segregation and condensation protein A [Thiothrix sp.]HPE60051.1 segregation and condensation protein A [Thiolinea sp.]
MSEEHLSQEKRILMAMRKTLAHIVRDLSPTDRALSYPLSEETVQDIRACFELISARERELAREAGVVPGERPRFADEPRNTRVVPMQGLSRRRNGHD